MGGQLKSLHYQDSGLLAPFQGFIVALSASPCLLLFLRIRIESMPSIELLPSGCNHNEFVHPESRRLQHGASIPPLIYGLS